MFYMMLLEDDRNHSACFTLGNFCLIKRIGKNQCPSKLRTFKFFKVQIIILYYKVSVWKGQRI